ncbi:MAG: tRNA lysidine(34) synthetase TilS, partial [Actinomycetota bacterium]|nr:tRNA lysidine(34) synthetase TilS [Actinomycetota bacterium]
MLSSPAIEALADAVEAGALLPPRSSGVVMVSGGADSACAAAAVSTLRGAASVAALHVNYALRADSDADERAARALCSKLRIDLHVERPRLGPGNLQARAREARYEAAERLRLRLEADWIATGHTRTDVAETVLYRLAASPGTRSLLGLAPRNGAVVRPLYSISREETRAVAEEARLPFVDDPTNASPRFARNRIRAEVLPVLAEIAPEVERNIAATHAELHEEAELLAVLVTEALERAGVEPGDAGIDAASVAAMTPALGRLALRELAGRGAGRPVPLSRSRAAQIIRLA